MATCVYTIFLNILLKFYLELKANKNIKKELS